MAAVALPPPLLLSIDQSAVDPEWSQSRPLDIALPKPFDVLNSSPSPTTLFEQRGIAQQLG